MDMPLYVMTVDPLSRTKASGLTKSEGPGVSLRHSILGGGDLGL